MKTALRLAAPVALVLALAPALARADVKLGFVDLQRALNEVDEGKAAKAQLKKDFEVKQKMLDERQDELKRMKADFDKQAVVMADAAKRQKQEELDKKFMETQQLYVQLQKELSAREQQLTKGIFQKMSKIMGDIAESEGFTMIFDRSTSGLVYAPASLDLTNELIRRYNGRAGKPAPKPAAARSGKR